ncbi:MAG: transglutaminase-like domain-containing protein [Acidimicrobiales bacterium]
MATPFAPIRACPVGSTPATHQPSTTKWCCESARAGAVLAGMTYGDYDGRYWTDSGRTQEFITPAGTLELQPGTSPIGSERLLQTFTVERAGLDVFLAADRMEVLHFDGFEGTWGINDNSIRPTRPLAAGAQWTVESAIIPVDAAQLRAADQFPQLVPPSVLRQYGAENDVSSATADLAEAITADAVTTYDKVLALEAWFADNVSYRQDVPAAPAGVDPVDRLLFDVNEGYCEQIASAMTVMLRSLGVPARIAVGYVPGEFDATTGEWLSRGTDARVDRGVLRRHRLAGLRPDGEGPAGGRTGPRLLGRYLRAVAPGRPPRRLRSCGRPDHLVGDTSPRQRSPALGGRTAEPDRGVRSASSGHRVRRCVNDSMLWPRTGSIQRRSPPLERDRGSGVRGGP